MTAEDCARIAKAYEMLVDWIGAGLAWRHDHSDSELWQDAACVLQQLIAEYEGWDL